MELWDNSILSGSVVGSNVLGGSVSDKVAAKFLISLVNINKFRSVNLRFQTKTPPRVSQWGCQLLSCWSVTNLSFQGTPEQQPQLLGV